MIKQIIHQNTCLALFMPKECGNNGTEFITPLDSALQVGVISRNTGESIAPHRHLPIETHYHGIKNEFIYIKSGRVTVTIFADDGTEVYKHTLVPGEAFLQLAGGHGFYFEEPTQMIEVKQGPYTDKQRDKELYE